MLVLSRRVGESVKIGDEVTVTVLGVKGGQVRLGFAAPAHLAVHREEVYERIKAETAGNHLGARVGAADSVTHRPLRSGR